MNVKMTLREKKTIDYAKKYKSWDYFCTAADSFSAGYKQALKDIEDCINYEEEVEVEFKDGDHQLTPRTLNK